MKRNFKIKVRPNEYRKMHYDITLYSLKYLWIFSYWSFYNSNEGIAKVFILKDLNEFIDHSKMIITRIDLKL